MNGTPGQEAPRAGRRPGRLFYAAVGLVCVFGIAVRLAQYLHGRALWLDEAALALQIVYKSPGELIGPLSWHQNSPFGFLLLVKFLTELFGTSEHALRLVPIVAGVLSVPLFAWLLWKLARTGERFRWELVLSGALVFAVSKHLIYYSSELRHYSVDVFTVCALILLALWAYEGYTIRPARLVVLFLAGIASTWLLLAMIFVLGGIVGAQCLSGLARRDWRWIAINAGIGLAWLGSFLLHLSFHSHNVEVRGLGPEIDVANAMSWAPFPPLSYDELKWYRETFDFMFYHPVGLTYRGLGGFAFLAGCVALWRRDRTLFWTLTLPFAFALFASYLHRYPFRDRYILFTAPLLIAVMANGVDLVFDKRWLGTRLVGAILLFMLVFQPTLHAAKVFGQPRGGYEIKPLLAHLTGHWHQDDGVYLPLKSVPQFMYYWPRIDFDAVRIPDELYYGRTELDFPGLVGKNLILEPRKGAGAELHDYKPFLRRWREEHYPPLLERSHSVWILFEHDTDPPIDTPAGEVDAYGRLLEVVYSDGATLYRYQDPDR